MLTVSAQCPVKIEEIGSVGVAKTHFFYRATRMRSADYAVARCLSVRLSHAAIESKRLYVSSNFFHHQVDPPLIFLVFPYQTGWQYSDGDHPPNGASNARGYEKIMMFDQYIALSRK